MVDTNVIVDGNLSRTEETGEEGGDVSNQNRNTDEFRAWYLIYNIWHSYTGGHISSYGHVLDSCCSECSSLPFLCQLT